MLTSRNFFLSFLFVERKAAGFYSDNKENSVNKIFRLGKSGILSFFASRNTVRKTIDPETPQITFTLLHGTLSYKIGRSWITFSEFA